MPGVGPLGLHDATTVGPLTVDGQLVVVQLLPLDAATGEQLPVGVGPVVALLQLVRVNALPALAPDAEQLLTATLEVTTLPH